MRPGRELLLVAPDLFDRGGGIARISRSLTLACHRACQERGWSFTALALRDSGQRRDLRYLPEPAGYFGFGENRVALARAVLNRTVAGKARGTIFCHVNLASLGFFFPPRRLTLRRACAVIAHGIEVWEPLPVHRRQALRIAREIWPVSAYTGRMVESIHGVPPERVRLLYNCLDPFWEGADRDAPASAPRLLCVSRLPKTDRYKGVDTLIEAFGLAAAHVPDLRLAIVGEGDDEPRLRALAQAGPATDRIDFLGGLSDEQLRDLYSSCRAFALPSRKEGFGLVFLEAMAHGKPVIAAAAGGAPEVIVAGSTGLLVPYGDVQALAAAIGRLAGDTALAKRFGAAGRQRVADLFTFKTYAARVAESLDRCFGHHGSES